MREPSGSASQDTQLAIWTSGTASGRWRPRRTTWRRRQQRIFGLGRTIREFIRRYKDEQIPWERAGVASAGAHLARIAPILVPHLRQPSRRCGRRRPAAMVTTTTPHSTGPACPGAAPLEEAFVGPDPRCRSLAHARPRRRGGLRTLAAATGGHLFFVEASVRGRSAMASASVMCDWWHPALPDGDGSHGAFILARHA